MKLIKSLGLITSLSFLGYLSFNITYEKVSAIVLKEAEERKEKEIKIKPIIVEDADDKEENNNPKIDKKEEKTLSVKTDNFIFIGDSRLNSLKDVSNNINFDSIDFITAENADYNWMINSGFYELNNVLNSTNGYYNIIFSPGIDDLHNRNRYVDFFNDIANSHPNQNIFILGVGPLDESKFIKNNIFDSNDIYNDLHPESSEDFDSDEETTIEDNNEVLNNATILSNADMPNNDDIYDFNIDIMKNVNDNVNIIHMFQELMLMDYKTTDGYYYDESTSNGRLEFIYNHIKGLQP